MSQPPSVDALDRLADAARRGAAELETVSANVSLLRGRIDVLEGQLEATQAIHTELTERIERLAAEMAQAGRREHMEAQIEALRASHTQVDERITRLATSVERSGRTETALTQLRTELTSQIEERDHALRAELAALRQRRSEDMSELSRELQHLQERVSGQEAFAIRLDGLDGRQDEQTLRHNQLGAQVERMGEERARFEDAVRRVEQQVSARVDGLLGRLEALQDETASWRDRINGQDETLRAARVVADDMRAEAVRLQEAHHTTAEAQRIAEERISAALDALRQEEAEAWERFLVARRNDWDRLKRSQDERATGHEQALASGLAAVGKQQSALEAATAAEQDHWTASLATLRAALLVAMHGWGEILSDLDAALGREPGDGPIEPAPAERRQALRRALRARRDARED